MLKIECWRPPRTAKATGKTVTFPAVELLCYRDEKICKVEMFLQDTKVILDTMEQ
jgi:hypothetical protein